MRILVVEDEKRLARTIGDLLEANNYTADLCYDGESGLDNAMSGIYDAMILDVMLPKLDGLTVARKLRQAGINLPVLMLTARSCLLYTSSPSAAWMKTAAITIAPPTADRASISSARLA